MRYALIWQDWQGETIAQDHIDADSLRDAIRRAKELAALHPEAMNLDIVLLVEAG